MSCSVAVAGASPVFSPSRIPLSCSCKVSPETLALTHAFHASDASPSSSGGSSSYRLLAQRGPTAARTCFHKDAFVALDSPGARTPVPPAVGPFPLLKPLAPAAAAASTILKRKRPSRINIPVMEPHDLAACSGIGEETVEAESARFSVFCKRGKTRKEMEDRYKGVVDVDLDPRLAFFGVFDGHAGGRAADFAAENICKHVMNQMTKGREENCDGYKEVVRTAYLKTDLEFLEKEEVGGACCVTAVIRDGDLIVSNAGDCRAVISNSGTAEALTSDHRPCREDERDRIERLGGYLSYCRGALRVQGCLAVSRGIGDGYLKQWVIAEPETRVVKIKPVYEFLILASDGLWDKVSNQEAVDVVRPFCIDTDKPLLLAACKELVDLTVARGSVDDVSVMIIPLRDFL